MKQEEIMLEYKNYFRTYIRRPGAKSLLDWILSSRTRRKVRYPDIAVIPNQQPEANPVMGLLTQMIVAAGQGEQEPEETGNKRKK